MVYLFVIALTIFDLMIVFTYGVKVIKSLIDSKTISGKLFWAVIFLILIVYIIQFYQIAIMEFFESGISILFYPPIIVLVYLILNKIKSSKKR